jgi:hypothetical protein
VTREIEIEIGKTVAVAKLLEEKAPKTCDAIWKELPFENEAHHAKIAGTEIYFMVVPKILVEEMENPVKVHATPPGTVSYFPPRPYVQIFLGDLLKVWDIDVNAFAVITENLQGIKMAARRAWRMPGERVILRKKGS